MRREMVTRDELDSLLREQGVENVGEVHAAYLEPDGGLSVLKASDGDHGRRARRNRAVG
jgi:uncharacterized membrane protein YcaP (DUF421 family)